MTIKILYTCDGCGLKDIPVDVPTRGPEDVIAYMDNVTPLLVADHQAKSPYCHPKTFTQIKIPLAPGSDRVGEPTKQ